MAGGELLVQPRDQCGGRGGQGEQEAGSRNVVETIAQRLPAPCGGGCCSKSILRHNNFLWKSCPFPAALDCAAGFAKPPVETWHVALLPPLSASLGPDAVRSLRNQPLLTPRARTPHGCAASRFRMSLCAEALSRLWTGLHPRCPSTASGKSRKPAGRIVLSRETLGGDTS